MMTGRTIGTRKSRGSRQEEGNLTATPGVIELNGIEMVKKDDISKVKYRILGRELCDGEK